MKNIRVPMYEFMHDEILQKTHDGLRKHESYIKYLAWGVINEKISDDIKLPISRPIRNIVLYKL